MVKGGKEGEGRRWRTRRVELREEGKILFTSADQELPEERAEGKFLFTSADQELPEERAEGKQTSRRWRLLPLPA